MSDARQGTDRRATPLWFRLDAAFLADDKLVILGEDHGPAGPLVFVALLAAAKAQELLSDVEGGVTMGWRSLKRCAFLDDVAQGKTIVVACVEVGLLEDVEADEKGFTGRIAAWAEKQIARAKAMTDAERAALYRARKKAREHHEPHDESVTDRHETVAGDHGGVTDRHEEITSHDYQDHDQDIPVVGSPEVSGRASENSRATTPKTEEDLNDPAVLAEKVRGILQRGVDGLTDDAPPGKRPTSQAILAALRQHAASVEDALGVAIEVRSIAQSQNKAPNIAALYAKKLAAKAGAAA